MDKDVKSFSDFERSKRDDIIVDDWASNEDVKAAMILQNTALALTEDGILEDGTYPLKTELFWDHLPAVEDNIMYQVVAVKTGKNIQMGVRVNQIAEQMFKRELDEAKKSYRAEMERLASLGFSEDHYAGPVRIVPPWIHFTIMFEADDHITEEEYDRLIDEHHPDLHIATHIERNNKEIWLPH